jgi:hypothetical protein
VTTSKKIHDSVKKAADEIATERVKAFLNELEAQIHQIGPLNDREISGTTIDGFLRRALSQAKLEGVGLNRAAFECWKILEAAGAKITHRDTCQIIPDPNIESKIVAAIERHFSGKK